MSEVALFQEGDLPAPITSSDQIAKITDAKSYLPRIQLMTSSAGKCKSGDFPINHYALVKNKDFIDCGKQIDVAVLDVRLKALDTSGDQPISVLNPELDENDNPVGEFKRIMEQSEVKDSGCMFGPEFLIYYPEKKVYATFFMGTKSARQESPNMQSLLHKGATLMSQGLKNTAHSWYAPKIEACQTELVVPDKQEILDKINQFRQEKSTQLGEVASEEEQASTDRAR